MWRTNRHTHLDGLTFGLLGPSTLFYSLKQTSLLPSKLLLLWSVVVDGKYLQRDEIMVAGQGAGGYSDGTVIKIVIIAAHHDTCHSRCPHNTTWDWPGHWSWWGWLYPFLSTIIAIILITIICNVIKISIANKLLMIGNIFWLIFLSTAFTPS